MGLVRLRRCSIEYQSVTRMVNGESLGNPLVGCC